MLELNVWVCLIEASASVLFFFCFFAVNFIIFTIFNDLLLRTSEVGNVVLYVQTLQDVFRVVRFICAVIHFCFFIINCKYFVLSSLYKKEKHNANNASNLDPSIRHVLVTLSQMQISCSAINISGFFITRPASL